jgi:hypothetical protein
MKIVKHIHIWYTEDGERHTWCCNKISELFKFLEE